MRRSIAAMVLAGAISFAAASADLPEKWRSWRYARAMIGNRSDTGMPAELTLPWEIFGHCAPGCDDLRIIDSHGEEVPFLIQNKGQQPEIESHATQIVENSFVENQFTQVIGDLGAGSEIFFDHVRVETSRSDFIVWAEVALSDDAKNWRVVESRAPIARFRARAVEGTQTIPFQGLHSRYIRVRIADSTAKFPVDGLQVSREVSSKFATKEVPSIVSEGKSADSSASLWRATLSSANQPLSELRVNTETPEFYRAVRISGSNDGQEWSYLGSGFIYRYTQGGKTRESLNVEFPETAGYHMVQVEVINGNDRPLANAGCMLAATSRKLVLKSSSGEQYQLLYGNEKAGKPQYDLARYFDFGPAKPGFLALALGPESTTDNYRDPRPFTERHPAVLWSALALAIALIGATAVRTLRFSGAPADKS